MQEPWQDLQWVYITKKYILIYTTKQKTNHFKRFDRSYIREVLSVKNSVRARNPTQTMPAQISSLLDQP